MARYPLLPYGEMQGITCFIFVYTFSTHYSSLRSLKRPTPYSRYDARRWTVARVGSVQSTYAVRHGIVGAAPVGTHPHTQLMF